jgi:threonine/homoserine/homoserine lactone efflux protein
MGRARELPADRPLELPDLTNVTPTASCGSAGAGAAVVRIVFAGGQSRRASSTTPIACPLVPGLDRLAAFAAVAFVIIVVPGPSVLFVVSRGVAFGRRTALTTVVGNEAGLSVQVLAVAFGLGAVVQRSIAVFNFLRFAGAAYLVVLGVRAIRHQRASADPTPARLEGIESRHALRQGFVVGLSNPKSIILFAAILPQFVSRPNDDITLQLIVLGFLAVTIALISDSAWALVAGTARALISRSPRSLRVLRGTGGLVMIGLGVRLALTGRRH